MAGDKLVIVERADMIQRAFRQVRGVEQIEPPFLARRRRRIKAEGHRFGERVGQRCGAVIRLGLEVESRLDVRGNAVDIALEDRADLLGPRRPPPGVALDLLQIVGGTARKAGLVEKIGRASCRERVCQYGLYSWVAGPLKKK